MSSITIHVADETDISELISLMRIYCEQSDEPHVPKPTNDDLLHLCHQIFQDPEHEGIYLNYRIYCRFMYIFVSRSFICNSNDYFFYL